MIPTFRCVPGCAVLAVQKPAETRPIESMCITHFHRVIEEKSKRAQRVLNIRKQVLQLALITALITEPQRKD